MSTSTWGNSTWSSNNWGSDEIVVALTGVSASTSIGTVKSFPEQGWGSDDWGFENWGESSLDITLSGLSATTATGSLTVTSGTFTIQFPTADATNAIIRIA